MQKAERLKTIYETIAPYITHSESSWKEYLSFAARLHKHSFDTALLVYAQNPNVTTLASTAQWNRVGRYVNRGEKGIAVCEYSNAKLTISHVFDISQTNGKPVTLTNWNISEDMQSEIVHRMTSRETAFPELLSKLSSDVTYKNYSRYFNSIKSNVSSGHIFSELPEAGLESQFIELLSDSITYMTAKRCGLADEDISQNDGMSTISHFNTIPLIAALGNAVTALSKNILLEIEQTIKNINYERTTQDERTVDRSRVYREERDTLSELANLERRESRSAARTVRQNGDGVPQTESPRPIYSFENGWESDGDNAQGAGRSDREDRNADTANAGNRPTAANRRYTGESETLQQPETVSGGSRDTGDRIVTVPVSEQSNTHEQEPSHDGSFSLPLAQYLERMMLTTLFYNLDFFSRIRYINASGDSDERKAERIKAAYFSEGDKSGEIENTPVSITVSDTSLTFHIGSDGVYDCSFEWNTIQELVRGYIENGSFPEQSLVMTDEEVRRHYEYILTSENLYPKELHTALRSFLSDEPENDDWTEKAEQTKAVFEEYGNREFQGQVKYRTVLQNEGVQMYFGNGYTYLPWNTLANIVNSMIMDGDYPAIPEIAEDKTEPSFSNDTEKYSYKLEYQLLSRLKSDCKYFLGNGNHAEKHLWAGSVEKQIAKMRELYNSLPEKPEWITEQEIDNYEQRMMEGKTAIQVETRKRATIPERNFRAFEKLFPQIVSGEYISLRLEAGESFDPLVISHKYDNRYSMEHYYLQNGDRMYDPYMEFLLDTETQTMQSAAYENSGLGIYQEVYVEGGYYPKLQKDLNNFISSWLKNISSQSYIPIRAITLVNDEEFEIQFDKEGNPIIEKTEDISFDDESVLPQPPIETVQQPSSDIPSQVDTQLSFFDIEPEPDVIQENEESVHEPEITEIAEQLQTAPITAVVPETVPAVPAAKNFRYTDDMDLYPIGMKSKYKANVAAIKLLKVIESERRTATPEEQLILARYVGWGGLANAFNEKASDWKNEYQELKLLLTADEYKAAMDSTLTAYYTDPELIQHIYSALQRFGFEGGSDRRILDPAMGTGNFYSVFPSEFDGTNLYGVELDSITGRIAKLLYPEANVQNCGYERTQFEDNSFDIILGNIPFNGIKIYDERYNKHNFMIHDYFIARSLDLLKPNGIIAFITSKGTMDKRDTSVRRYIAERAELIGAVRLPNTAFKAIAGTEVTADILFLQKRPEPIEFDFDNEPEWIYTDINRESNWVQYNSYYHSHPEMVLGEMVSSKKMYGREDGTACIAPEGYNLYAELDKALSRLSAEFSAAPDIAIKANIDDEAIEDTELSEYAYTPKGTRNYTFVIQDDKVYYCENNKLIPQNLSTTKAARIKGLCAIRDELLDVINMQSQPYEEHELKAKQAILNRVYDTFYAKYGAINSRANSMVFSDDDQYPLLRSIENEIKDKDGSIRYEKAQIFYKATIHPHTIPTHVDTAEEALYLSLNTKLKIDLRYMSELTGKEPTAVIEELGDKVYLNPQKYYGNLLEGWETAEEYLSGYVKDKLLYARNKAEEFPELFSRNVTALEAAQPIPLTPADIDYSIGAPWIPLEYYQQFMYEIFDTPKYYRDHVKLNYMEYTTVWHVVNKGYDSNSVKVTQTYGTSRRNAYEIFEDCLNLQNSTVKDKVQYTDPLTGQDKEKYVINNAETRIARSKQAQIKEAFAAWLWKDNERKEVLLNIYNDRFNTLVPREYDGSHLIFPSMSEEMKLRPHQLNFAARVIYSGTGLAAHEVGAGKTAALIAAGMYLKNIGAIKKPMYVVPNPLVGQWASEFYRFFPNAKLLVSTVEDFSAKNRNRYVSRIAMGDYDAVILAHSQFEKIPISYERQERMLQGQINDISNAIIRAKEEKGDNWTIKQMVAFQKNLERRLKDLSAEAKKDDLLTFEQLGVDFMFVDEAHLFKNCFTYTKLSRVAGVNTSSSQRAFDMLLKCQYLQEVNNGRGVVFATGTPISNSMSEMYIMMRYLEPKELMRQGLSDFDSWAATYGEITSSLEITPEGNGYRMRQRFSKFHNIPELMRTFRLVSDIQTADMLNLPRPEIRGGKAEVISTPATEYQHRIMDSFVERAEAIRAKSIDPTVDNMLKLTGEARLMAIDPRLIDVNAPNDPDTKLNLCIDKVYEIWHDTEADRLTQLVFCDCGTPKADEFNVYDEMKRVLLERGIPANEIVFIHDAKTEAQRQEIFEKTRNGDIRILIGSTGKLGTGVNVQDRVIALHHLDVPWKPSDITQRNGRGLRQGNRNPEISIYHYVTEGSFDGYLWQIQEQKLKYITQVMTSKSITRSCEDIDETVLTAAQFKAIATDNPEVLMKMELENRVSELRILQRNYQNEQEKLERKINVTYPKDIEDYQKKIGAITADIETLEQTENADFSMALDGKVYTERTEAGEMLTALSRSLLQSSEESTEIGVYRGLKLKLMKRFIGEVIVQLEGGYHYSTTLGLSGIGDITRIENLAKGIQKQLQLTQQGLDDTKRQLEECHAQYGKPFLYEAELSEKSAKLTEINTTLELGGSQQDEVILDEDSQDKSTVNRDERYCGIER